MYSKPTAYQSVYKTLFILLNMYIELCTLPPNFFIFNFIKHVYTEEGVAFNLIVHVYSNDKRHSILFSANAERCGDMSAYCYPLWASC